MRIEDFHDLGLNEEELAELEQSLQLIGQAVQQEEEIPLPDSLRGEALLHLLDGVEQDAPDEEPAQEKTKPAGRLIFGVFPQKYLAAAAMLALAVMVGVAYNRLPRTAEIGTNEIGSSMASQEAPADSGSSAAALSYSEGAMLTAETADTEDAADFCRAVHAEKSPARTSRKTRTPNTYQRVRGENELGLEMVEDAETMRG